MNRREFLIAGAAAMVPAEAAPMPVIDTHIHLFDPTRPQGIPWPPKDSILYKPALPARYRQIAGPLGITGAIEVECSPLVEDNQWVLDVAGADSIMVGTVGNLEPGTPDFRKNLDRFHRNPLFRGIRYGNLWNRDPARALQDPAFTADLKALAAVNLSLDSANPDPGLIAFLLRVSDRVPGLRIIVDHLPQLNPPSGTAARAAYEHDLHELAKRPTVYVKISEVLRRVDGRVPVDLAFYRTRLDELFGLFGEDRVLYGSDWPNSDQWAEYPQVFAIVREYFDGKGRAAAEKYFWRNSVNAYGWRKRTPA